MTDDFFFETMVLLLLALCVLFLLLNFFAYVIEPVLDAYKERKLDARRNWEQSIEKRLENLENKINK